MLKFIGLLFILSLLISTCSGVVAFFIDIIRFGKKQFEEPICSSNEAYAARLESIEKEVNDNGSFDGSDYPIVSDIRL